ncbi:MAG: S8 family serine peptidase [Bacteroidota bacterium]
MKRFLFLVFLVILFLPVIGQQRPVPEYNYSHGNIQTLDDLPLYVEKKIFVKLRVYLRQDIRYEKHIGFFNGNVDSTLAGIVRRYHVESIEQTFVRIKNSELNSIFTFTLENDSDAESLITELGKLRSVEYAERMPAYYSFYIPNDPLYPASSYLTQISAPDAWDVETGNSTVSIAIVDDAVRITHEDLLGKIKINTAEIDSNGIDDDGNGYIDDVRGFDVSNNDGGVCPPSTVTPTYFSHGTFVAGIAAGNTNNSKGISSIGFNCSIIPVKCKPDSSLGNIIPDAYLGLEYATVMHASVINMSWGGFVYSNTYQLLCTTAHIGGSVLVAAAGNTGNEMLIYPAAYDSVISVGSVNPNDMLSAFSTRGSWLDIVAPGLNIAGTLATSDTSYATMSGTSMAAPIISGICGLMISNNSSLTVDEVEQCLESGSTNINYQNPSNIGKTGSGRADALGAVTCSEAPPKPHVCNGSCGLWLCPGSSIQFFGSSYGLSASSWQWTFPGGIPSTSTLQNPVVTYPYSGLFDVVLVTCNSFGCDTLVLHNYVYVSEPVGSLTANYTGTFCAGSVTYLNFELFGYPPFTITYTDGTNTWTINNIQGDIQIPVYPSGPVTYSFISMSDAYCPGNASGQVSLTPVECSPCSNTDFEFSNFSTWEGMLGECCGDTNFIAAIESDRMAIVSGTNMDPYSLNTIPEVSPFGGIYSARLGNWLVGGESEKLSKSMLITPDNCMFTYQFAVILEDPIGHPPMEKPKFQVRLLDVNGHLLPDSCAFYQVTAGPETDGWMHNNNVRFKNWTPVTVDLTPYLGQIITAEFKTEDCGWLGHFGYAYIDASCGPQEIDVLNFCDTTSSITISAPVGYTHYEWIPYGDTTQTITIPSPATGDTVMVNMTNVMGCSSTITHVFQILPTPLSLISHDTTICEQSIITLTASGAGPGGTYLWTSNPSGFTSTDSIIIVSPAVSTTYSVMTENANGCPADSAVHIVVTVTDSAEINITAHYILCYDDTQMITVSNPGATFSWSSFPPGFSSTEDTIYVSPDDPMIYIVTAFKGNCSFADSVFVNPFPYLYDDAVANTYICSGTTQVTLSPPNGYANFEWHSGGDTTQSITINNPVPYSMYWVSMISSIGCLDTMRFMISPVMDPEAHAGADTSICSGQPAMLNGSGAMLSSGTYEWSSIPMGSYPDVASIVVSPVVTTTYILQVTNGPNCDSPASYDTVVVSVMDVPSFELGSDITICAGNSVTLGANYPGGFFFWESDPPGFYSTDTIVTVFPTEETIYYLTINTHSCSYNDYLTIHVEHGGQLADTIEVEICPGDSVVTLIAPLGYSSYSWLQTGDTTQITSVYHPLDGDLFTVLGGKPPYGCVDTILVKVIEKKITYNPQISSSDTSICSGTHITLEVEEDGNTTIIWYSIPNGFSASGFNTSAVPNDTMIFICAANIDGCMRYDSLRIDVTLSPQFQFPADMSICSGDSVLLNPDLHAGSYLWDDGSMDSTKTVFATGTYMLELSNGSCSVRDTFNLEVIRDTNLIIPNVFTPNGDGQNDKLLVQLTHSDIFEFEIFNRWGVSLFKTSDPMECWDGSFNNKLCDVGVYYYICRYKSICKNEVAERKGFVHLMR